MVYELRTYTLIPGKMPEYLKAAETIGRPARGNNYGVNHGYWTSEFGALNQIWHLWKYDSYEERTRLRGELMKNEKWTKGYVPVIRPLIQRQDLRLMNPVVDILPDDGKLGVLDVKPKAADEAKFKRVDFVALPEDDGNLPKASPIQVRCGVGSNGLIDVMALEMTSGKIARTEIHRSSGLSEAEIASEAEWVRGLRIQ